MIDKMLIAKVCYEVNRAYCVAIGEIIQLPWESTPIWQSESVTAGVEAHLANPAMTPEDSHNSWLAQKQADGWKWGPNREPEKKEHPCFCPYTELPVEQRVKDYLFKGVVDAMRHVHM